MQAMAQRWGAAVGELTNTVAPAGLGLSCQLSAAAVDAAHDDVSAFIARLSAQVSSRVTGVVRADRGYLANEAASATALAAVTSPTSV